MNEKFEQYIKDLSPELQEKARQCKDMNELQEFIAENDIEIPEDALEMVSGGGCGDCDHDHDKTAENWGLIVNDSERPVIKGVSVRNLKKNVCSKCGGDAKYCILGSITDIGGGYAKSEYAEISEAEFNNIKAAYTWQNRIS